MYIVVRVGIFHTVTIEHKWVHSHLTIVNFCIFTKIKMLTYKKLGAKICINIQTKMFLLFRSHHWQWISSSLCGNKSKWSHTALYRAEVYYSMRGLFSQSTFCCRLVWNHNSLCTLSLSFMIIEVWSFKRLLQNTGTSTYFDCLVCTCQNK